MVRKESIKKAMPCHGLAFFGMTVVLIGIILTLGSFVEDVVIVLNVFVSLVVHVLSNFKAFRQDGSIRKEYV